MVDARLAAVVGQKATLWLTTAGVAAPVKRATGDSWKRPQDERLADQIDALAARQGKH